MTLHVQILSAIVLWLGPVSCQSSYTQTRAASTETFAGGLDVRTGTVISTYKDTTVTELPTTISIPKHTITIAAATVVGASIPSELGMVEDITLFNDIWGFASTATSFNTVQISKAVSDLEAFYTSIATQSPYILAKATDDLELEIANGSTDEPRFTSAVEYMYDPWNASHTSIVASLLSPFPQLSSEALDYMSVARTFRGSSYLTVASIVSKDLSLTGPSPTWLSDIASTLSLATATTTTSSSGFAAETGGVTVLMNAGAAAAGMIVLFVL